MRIYLRDQEEKEHIIELANAITHSKHLFEYQFLHHTEQETFPKFTVFIRILAGKYFASLNGKQWEKIARQDLPPHLLSVDKVFKIFRGYKPAGLSQSAKGELRTQMPGKVVKLLVEMGQKVKQGEPLIILEAMKMENEIISGVDGLVKAIHVKEGDTIEQGIIMLEIE